MGVTDKRADRDHYEYRGDPVTALVNKVFAFIQTQPEFFIILSMGREARKRLGHDVAKTITRFPHLSKARLEVKDERFGTHKKD